MLLTPIVREMYKNVHSYIIFILCWSRFINKCVFQKVVFFKEIILFFLSHDLKNKGNKFFSFQSYVEFMKLCDHVECAKFVYSIY